MGEDRSEHCTVSTSIISRATTHSCHGNKPTCMTVDVGSRPNVENRVEPATTMGSLALLNCTFGEDPN